MRAEVLKRLEGMPADERTRRSEGLAPKLRALDAWAKSDGGLMGYLHMGTEADVAHAFWPAWADGRTVSVPRTDWEQKTIEPVRYGPGIELRVGKHGVPEVVEPEPVEIESLGIVLVPGVAFDATGARLGRGGGFYDRFLERLSAIEWRRPVFVGVCFAEQMVDRVPVETHDVRMDTVIQL